MGVGRVNLMESIIKMQSLQLKELLKQTELIETELATLRSDLASPTATPTHPPSHYLERAVALRLAFRAMAEGIEGKRGLAQLQKERIEKSKIFLEGLQYYKTTLQAKIRQSEIQVVDLQEYLQQPLTVENWVEEFPTAEARLKSELEVKRSKKAQFEQLQADKARRLVETTQKRELYEKILPQHALKLYEQVAETGKLFNIVEMDAAPALNNTALAAIFDRLAPLRSSKLLELTVSCDQFEEIEIVLLPIEHAYYKQAKANKLPLVERQFKWSVASLGQHYDRLVVGVHRREDFNNEEMFHRLVAGENAKEVFSNPTSEFERNINAKYVRMEWVESLLLTGVLSPHALLELMRERLFCLQLTAHLVEQAKKVGFFFPLTSPGENPLPLNLKKSAVGSLQKIKFSDYVQLVHTPSWVEKYLNICNLTESERKGGNLDAQLKGGADRILLQQVLKVYKLQQLAEEQLNSYYRGSFTLNQTSVSFVLLIPYNYPKTPSHVKLLQIAAKKEEEPRPANLPLPCRLKLQPRKPFSDRCLAIERAVNEDIGEFLKNPSGNPFRVLLQLNRLLSLFAEPTERRS